MAYTRFLLTHISVPDKMKKAEWNGNYDKVNHSHMIPIPKRRMCVKRKMSLKQVARHDCRHHHQHTTVNRTPSAAPRLCAPFNSDGLSANCRFCLSVPSANSETTQVLFVLLYHPSWFLLVSAPFANFWISVSSYICDYHPTTNITRLGTVIVIVIYAGQEINKDVRFTYVNWHRRFTTNGCNNAVSCLLSNTS